ncbi:MAG TPA: hypothetical protein VJZ76_25245 [Thermoanaerobaculia bacterium]|nr:hypothetical protein [Thermoanaerobaculia bacterium]
MIRFLKCSLFSVVALFIATAAFADKLPANRHILIIADPEHGLALVPEGTPIPRSLILRVDQQKAEATFMRQTARGDDSPIRPDAPALKFVHAPESAFTKARAAMERANAGKLRLPGKLTPNDFYFSISVYFSSLDATIELDLDFVSYAYTGANTYVHAGDSNDLAFGAVYGTQSSNLSPDAFAASCYHSFTGSADTSCSTGYYYASATSATVTMYGRVNGRTYDGCGLHGAAPCTVGVHATIIVSYEWLNSSEYSTDYSSDPETE